MSKNSVKAVMRNGKKVELHPPFCDLCKTHMGREYHREGEMGGSWKNPNEYESFEDSTCPKCGQKYIYEEGLVLSLTKKQLGLLRKHKGL